MNAIVAVDKKWAIGKDNELLFHIKEDLKRFKELTTDKAVIMGRKTFESLPNKKPLPNRDNYILSRDNNYNVEGAVVIHSVEDFLNNYAHKYLTNNIFIIGGSEIYKLFFYLIDDIYVTKIHKEIPDANKFFINLDLLDNYKITDKSNLFIDENGLNYEFILYTKNII